MNITSEQFKNNILLIGKTLQIPVEPLLLHTATGFPELVKIIVYKLFLKNYIHTAEKNDEVYSAVCSLKTYGKELEEKGFVEFK